MASKCNGLESDKRFGAAELHCGNDPEALTREADQSKGGISRRFLFSASPGKGRGKV